MLRSDGRETWQTWPGPGLAGTTLQRELARTLEPWSELHALSLWDLEAGPRGIALRETRGPVSAVSVRSQAVALEIWSRPSIMAASKTRIPGAVPS